MVMIALQVVGGAATSAARAATPPRYAVAFGFHGGTRIAALEVAGTWRFDDLPKSYFGQGDVGMIRTQWSPDGRTAYLNYPAPGDGQYRFLYAYDVVTRQQTPVVFLDQASTGGDFMLISVSPDGRYLWVIRLISGSSRLIDTQATPERRVVARLPDCPAEARAWLTGRILVQGFLNCANTETLLDLRTGATLYSVQQAQPEADLTFAANVIELPGDSAQALAYLPGSLSKLSLRTGKPEAWLEADWLTMAPDRKSAAYVRGGRLFSLDLTTLSETDLGTIDSVRNAFTSADGPVFVTASPADHPRHIDQVTVRVGKRTHATLYDGAPFEASSFGPGGQGFVLDFGKGNGYALFDGTGKRVWRSQEEPAALASQFNFDLANNPGRWTAHWFHTVVKTEDNQLPDNPGRSFAVSVETGRSLTAPEDAPMWVSASPDEAWWLYAGLDQSTDMPHDRLMAVNIDTGKAVTFSDDELLAQRNFHFPVEEYYAWSGPIR